MFHNFHRARTLEVSCSGACMHSAIVRDGKFYALYMHTHLIIEMLCLLAGISYKASSKVFSHKWTNKVLLTKMESKSDSLGELIEAFRSYRASLQIMLNSDTTENKMSEADQAVGILFDKIVGFQAKNQDDKTAMIKFSLNMIDELSEGDSMISLHTRLIRQYI